MNMRTLFAELFHNALAAGADEITVTTEADDYGGTVVQIEDNGDGIREPQTLVRQDPDAEAAGDTDPRAEKNPGVSATSRTT